MGQVVSESIIAIPREQAWAKLRDLSIAHFYVPGLTDTKITTAQKEGIGTSRQVFSKSRPPMDETVVEWRDGYGFTLKLHNGDKPPAPFKEATFQYAVEDAPGGQTLFRGTLRYTLPFGVIGQILDSLFLERMLAPATAGIGPAIKTFYETGKSANPLVP